MLLSFVSVACLEISYLEARCMAEKQHLISAFFFKIVFKNEDFCASSLYCHDLATFLCNCSCSLNVQPRVTRNRSTAGWKTVASSLTGTISAITSLSKWPKKTKAATLAWLQVQLVWYSPVLLTWQWMVTFFPFFFFQFVVSYLVHRPVCHAIQYVTHYPANKLTCFCCIFWIGIYVHRPVCHAIHYTNT